MVAIVGPTASGKSALALELAAEARAEIVSVDSMQIYRGMDVGTAKPTASEREAVPHHLIDVASPDDPWDARRYADAARGAIDAIHARGGRALLVGGTGLWLRALLHGLAPAPGADPELRAAIRDEAARAGRAAVHARLRAIDPEAAARISPNDLVRMERAFEAAAGGQTLSALQKDHRFAEDRYRALLVGLSVPGPELSARIEARTRRMFDEGLVEEVEGLLSRYGPGIRPLGAVGYREVVRLLAGDADRAGTIEAMARSTRKYAKRQMTWFRSEPGIEWATAETISRNRIVSHLFMDNSME